MSGEAKPRKKVSKINLDQQKSSIVSSKYSSQVRLNDGNKTSSRKGYS